MSESNEIRETVTSSVALRRHAPLIVAEALFVFSALSALMHGEHTAAVIPVALLLASLPVLLVERWARVEIPARLQGLYAVLLLGGPYLGSQLGFYAIWTPWDTLVHFYSGFVVALGIVFALGITGRRYGFSMPPWLAAVMIVAFSGFVALLWEIAEFASDAVLGTEAQITNFDTMTDLIAGTGSAIIVAAMLFLVQHRGRFPATEVMTQGTPPRQAPDASISAAGHARNAPMTEGATR